METIGFIGGGNMAEALIKGIAAKLYEPENIFVSDILADRLDYLAGQYGIQAIAKNSELAGKADTIVLSIKPQNMAEVLEEIKDAVGEDTLVISIAAGVKVSAITAVLGNRTVVRAMPNTPALIGKGISALFANKGARPAIEKAEAIFSAVGEIVVINDEEMVDAVAAVSGCGPAYYFLLAEEMIKAAVGLGLPEEVAKKLVLQTARGATLLAIEGQKNQVSPAELRQKVTSPGGMTEAALKVFEVGKFGQLVERAIKSARDKGQELSG